MAEYNFSDPSYHEDKYDFSDSSYHQREQGEELEDDRSLFEQADDFMRNTSGAAVGLIKAATDLIAPGSAASESIGQFIKDGHENSSDYNQERAQQLAQKLAAAKEAGDTGIGELVLHYASNPGLLGAEALGNAGPFGALAKVSKAAVGAKGATGIMGGAGAAVGAGGTRGGYYDQLQGMDDAELLKKSPDYLALRQELSEQAAKKELGQRLTPELAAGMGLAGGVGLATGPTGLGRAIINPGKSGVGAAAAEIGGEFVQGMAEQTGQNIGMRGVDPEAKLGEDVLLSGAHEAIVSGPSGVAAGIATRAQQNAPTADDIDNPAPGAELADPIEKAAQRTLERNGPVDTSPWSPSEQMGMAGQIDETAPMKARNVDEAIALAVDQLNEAGRLSEDTMRQAQRIVAKDVDASTDALVDQLADANKQTEIDTAYKQRASEVVTQENLARAEETKGILGKVAAQQAEAHQADIAKQEAQQKKEEKAKAKIETGKKQVEKVNAKTDTGPTQMQSQMASALQTAFDKRAPIDPTTDEAPKINKPKPTKDYADEGAVRKGKDRSESGKNFLNAIARAGGISASVKSDVLGDKGNKTVQGKGVLFRDKGKNLDELAQSMVEEGYLTQADIDRADDNGGVNQLTEMIQAAIRGEEVASKTDDSAIEREAQRVGEEQELVALQDEIRKFGEDPASMSVPAMRAYLEDNGEALAERELSEIANDPEARKSQARLDKALGIDKKRRGPDSESTPTVVSVDTLPDKPTATDDGRTTLSKKEAETIDKMAGVFGKRVVLFRGASYDGFANPKSDKDTIYVNADAKSAHHLVVAGHELTHQMRLDNPRLYNRLKTKISKDLKEGALDNFKDYYGDKFSDSDALLEEVISDVVGNRFGEYKTGLAMFGAAKGSKDHDLIYRVGQYVMSFIDNLLSKSSFKKFATDDIIGDLKKARREVRNTLKEYAKSQSEGGKLFGGIQQLDINEGPVQQSGESSVQGLRGKGDKNLPGVGKRLPGVSEGSGPKTDAAALNRTKGQQQGVSARKRSVGDKEGAGAKSSQQRNGDSIRKDANDSGVGGGNRSKGSDDSGPNKVGGKAGSSGKSPDDSQNVQDQRQRSDNRGAGEAGRNAGKDSGATNSSGDAAERGDGKSGDKQKAGAETESKSPERGTIEVDGKQRPTKNSNGKPIAATEEATRKFWEWFGNSKVVDGDGRPLVLYHSTLKGDLTSFNATGKFMGYTGVSGISLTDNPEMAARYLDRFGEFGFVDDAPMQAFSKNIMAVYAKADSPLHRQEPFETGVRLGAPLPDGYVNPVKEMGHDALIRDDAISRRGAVKHSEAKNAIKGKEIILFDPGQIKSATGNNGSFDPSNPDIRKSEERTESSDTWDMPTPSKFDDFLYSLQDKQVDMKRVVQAVKKKAGEIADEFDPYLTEELYHGRTAKQSQDFLKREVEPLLKEMQAGKIDLAGLGKYLHARHAQERNAHIATINKDMPDGGSGMKNADAKKYLSELSASDKRKMESLAKRIDAIGGDTRKLLVSSGLESADTIKAWEGAYKNYVPLQREEVASAGSGTGQGFSVRGSASKRAIGSDKDVADIVANIVMQREQAIVRSEKNRVAVAMWGLAASAPNFKFWKAVDPELFRKKDGKGREKLAKELVQMGLNPIDAKNVISEPKQKYVDPRTGLVAERVNPMLRTARNVVSMRVDGKERYVVFNDRDERAVRMSGALKNLDADQMGRVLGVSAKISRYISAINTQWNPLFAPINLTRDAQGAMINLTSTPLAGKQVDVAKNVPLALAGIYKDLRAQRAGRESTSEWSKLNEEFQQQGGQTGYRDMFDNSEDRAANLEKELKKLTENKAKGAGRAVMQWLSDYNDSAENSVRLAVYKVALENGHSKKRAASMAKNISVNFNRKGQVTTQAGALYAFFNAAVQGTTRMGEALAGPKGRQIVYGGLVLGSAQALMLAAAGFDEDEIPEFVRERNLIIPTGGDSYVTIPMPLGLHVIPNLARIPTEFMLSGFEAPEKRAMSMISVVADAFNPIGNAGVSMQTIAPTPLDPFAAILENRDFAGRPISREDFNGLKPTPGHTRARDSANIITTTASEVINMLTGGTEYKPGAISPTPEQISYLFGAATGGIGRETLKITQTGESLITGEELPSYKVPLFGKFIGNTSGQAAQASRFYSAIKRINQHDLEIKGRRENGETMGSYYRDNPEARLVNRAKAAHRQISKLRKRKRQMVENGASKSSVQAMEKMITAQIQRFNTMVERQGQSAG